MIAQILRRSLAAALFAIAIGAAAGLAATPAFAQEIQFSSDVTQANGQASPTLTWDTTPLASNCVASGDWSGDKGGAGTETLPTITSSATYTLTCTWTGVGSATLSWIPPTENTDGSPLTDLAGYRLYYGVESGNYPAQVEIDNPGVTTYVVEGLAEGTWHFVATAYNSAGLESDYSEEATKLVQAPESSESVAIVINPVPNPPSGLTAN